MTESLWLSVLMVMFMSLFFAERNVTRKEWYREIERLHTFYQDQVDKLTVYNREQYEKFQQDRDSLLDRLQAESFREYKSQQIKMVKATNNVPEERPIFDELL